MKLKNLILLICFLTNTYHLSFSQNSIPVNKKQAAPVKIFYAPNESHSNSWIKCTKEGIIGISYFKHNSFESIDGNLVYKTILTDGTGNEEIVASGARLEISVLIYDKEEKPHIFVAQSTPNNQFITHYYKNDDKWIYETVVQFNSEGGNHIYELSADKGPAGDFHILALLTRSNPDSDDYYYATINANLYHISNSTGNWTKEPVKSFNAIWTFDEYAKSFSRQDIKVDKNGFVHIIFGELIGSTFSAPSNLQYASNKSGKWIFETASAYAGGRDDGGWFSSLCLDNNDVPCISCTYISRVTTGSAMYAKLLYLKRIDLNNWSKEIVATTDDGYYGTDGRRYTGGLTHLVFDKNNSPHIIFTDIASSHAGMNYFNLGNVRHAVKKDNNWGINTIYRQPLPKSFFSASEMYSLCLLTTDNNETIKFAGLELILKSSTDYFFNIVVSDFKTSQIISTNFSEIKDSYQVKCFPNPFSYTTNISFTLNKKELIKINIFDIKGKLLKKVFYNYLDIGNHTIKIDGSSFKNSFNFYKLEIGNTSFYDKLLIIK